MPRSTQDTRAARRLADVFGCGVLFGVIERPLLDEACKGIEIDVFEQLVVMPTEVLFVPNRSFGDQVEDMKLIERADGHFQAAEIVVSFASLERQIVAANGGPPADVGDYLILEAREIIGQLTQAGLDGVAELESIGGVQAPAFFFAESLRRCLACFGIAGVMTSFGSSL